MPSHIFYHFHAYITEVVGDYIVPPILKKKKSDCFPDLLIPWEQTSHY